MAEVDKVAMNGVLQQPAAVPSAWIELPHTRWDALVRDGARTVRFDKGQTVFSQGQPVTHVHVVEEGRIRLAMLSAAGHEKHMAIVGTQGLVGECSAFLDGRHSVTAIASTDVVTRQVDIAQFRRVVEEDAQTLRQVMWLVSVKLRILANQNLLLSQATAAQRVVYNLVQLADTYGEAVADGGVSIRISFTHQEMANIAGLSRVMASTVLAELHGQGLIGKAGPRCVVHDLPALRSRTIVV